MCGEKIAKICMFTCVQLSICPPTHIHSDKERENSTFSPNDVFYISLVQAGEQDGLVFQKSRKMKREGAEQSNKCQKESS